MCMVLGYFGCKLFNFIIVENGGYCVMVLIGNYECVMLLDIFLLYLFCDLEVGDIDLV